MCVSACVSVLISATSLPALVPCQREVRASSTLPSDSLDTHKGCCAHHPGTSPNLARLLLPTARGNTHQLHLGTQSFQDPVGSLCLLLQGGKRGRRKVISAMGNSCSPPLLLSPCAKTPSQTSAEPLQIPPLPESGWKGSAQPPDLQESPMGKGLRHSSYHDFNASELCPGSDPNPQPLWVPGGGNAPVTSARPLCEEEGG